MRASVTYFAIAASAFGLVPTALGDGLPPLKTANSLIPRADNVCGEDSGISTRTKASEQASNVLRTIYQKLGQDIDTPLTIKPASAGGSEYEATAFETLIDEEELGAAPLKENQCVPTNEKVEKVVVKTDSNAANVQYTCCIRRE